MGKLGKKARKFGKKNLQSAEKRNRKQKPFLKRKFAKRDGRREVKDEEEKKIEQPHKKRCLEENPQDIFIDAVFDKDEGEALGGGYSDSDGYLAEDSGLTNAVAKGTEGKISDNETTMQSKEILSELKKKRRKVARLNEKQNKGEAIDHPMQLVDEAESDIMTKSTATIFSQNINDVGRRSWRGGEKRYTRRQRQSAREP